MNLWQHQQDSVDFILPLKAGRLNITKKCSKCGETKSLEEFCRDRGRQDGLQSYCRQCNKEYRAANRGIINAYAKEYREINREVILSYKKEYYVLNREVIADKRKANREANIAYLASVRPLQCEVCGYDKSFAALDFHHTNPSQKERVGDSMGLWIDLKFVSFKSKFDANHFKILCANCHRELHSCFKAMEGNREPDDE